MLAFSMAQMAHLKYIVHDFSWDPRVANLIDVQY